VWFRVFCRFLKTFFSRWQRLIHAKKWTDVCGARDDLVRWRYGYSKEKMFFLEKHLPKLFSRNNSKTYCKFYVHKYWTNINDSCPPRMPSHWHTRISQNTRLCKSLSISVSISSEIARFSTFSVLKIRKTSAAVMTLSYHKCSWNALCGRRARNSTAGAIYSGRAHRAGSSDGFARTVVAIWDEVSYTTVFLCSISAYLKAKVATRHSRQGGSSNLLSNWICPWSLKIILLSLNT